MSAHKPEPGCFYLIIPYLHFYGFYAAQVFFLFILSKAEKVTAASLPVGIIRMFFFIGFRLPGRCQRAFHVYGSVARRKANNQMQRPRLTIGCSRRKAQAFLFR